MKEELIEGGTGGEEEQASYFLPAGNRASLSTCWESSSVYLPVGSQGKPNISLKCSRVGGDGDGHLSTWTHPLVVSLTPPAGSESIGLAGVVFNQA